MATAQTDADVGVPLLVGLLALAAAAFTLVAPSQAATAWGFAASVTLAVLLVAAIHVYGVSDSSH